jgi:polyhydroxyalkanoate synthesis repressor PhaR
MSSPRIIKKYQNRCLYDTSQSKYISMSDLKKLVIEGEPFEVREVKSDKDITRQVLLQIIAEEESAGDPLFSTDVLEQFIRMYGDSVQDSFRTYFEQSLGFFDQQSRQFMERLGESADYNPMSAWADLTRKNLEYWQDAQRNMMRAAGMEMPPSEKSKDQE